MQPSRFQVFVPNRISEIQQLTNCDNWRHVPTQENPADLLSRGLSLDFLIKTLVAWSKFVIETRNVNGQLCQKSVKMELRKTICTLKREMYLFLKLA